MHKIYISFIAIRLIFGLLEGDTKKKYHQICGFLSLDADSTALQLVFRNQSLKDWRERSERICVSSNPVHIPQRVPHLQDLKSLLSQKFVELLAKNYLFQKNHNKKNDEFRGFIYIRNRKTQYNVPNNNNIVVLGELYQNIYYITGCTAFLHKRLVDKIA